MGARHVVSVITTNYGATGGGGDTPSQINMASHGQGQFFRHEWYDESILIKRPTKEYEPDGVEQLYEKDIEVFRIHIATLTSEDRYDIIEAEVRRIMLNFKGNSYYSRLHLSSMEEQENDFYSIAKGYVFGYMNLSHANDS